MIPLELLCMHVHVHAMCHAILRVLSPQLRALDAQGVTPPRPLAPLSPPLYTPLGLQPLTERLHRATHRRGHEALHLWVVGSK